jgi:hypothetical protein
MRLQLAIAGIVALTRWRAAKGLLASNARNLTAPELHPIPSSAAWLIAIRLAVMIELPRFA